MTGMNVDPNSAYMLQYQQHYQQQLQYQQQMQMQQQYYGNGVVDQNSGTGGTGGNGVNGGNKGYYYGGN